MAIVRFCIWVRLLIFFNDKTHHVAGFIVRAEEEIRTPKPFQALPPQSSASTNFATSAFEVAAKIIRF